MVAEGFQQEAGGMMNLVRRLSYEKPQRSAKRRRLCEANCPSSDSQVSSHTPNALLHHAFPALAVTGNDSNGGVFVTQASTPTATLEQEFRYQHENITPLKTTHAPA